MIANNVICSNARRRNSAPASRYTEVSGLQFWLETKNDSYIVKDASNFISRQIDRIQAINLDQNVAASKPTYIPEPGIFNNHDASNFDMFSGDQFLSGSLLSAISSAQTGNIYLATYIVPLIDGEWLWSVSDTSRDDVIFGIKTYDAGAGSFRFAFHHVNSGGTPTVAYGDTVITAGGPFVVEITSQGTSMFMYVNGVLQNLTYASATPNGDWFADLLTPNMICINHLITNSLSQVGPLSAFALLLIYDTYQSAADRAIIYDQLETDFPEITFP